ncbi:hypothetical protein B0A48_07495 [Cryoendolithus antarcticus]|uniref:Uncharacterized protein n=1 Tax=Cryoendolithus antarcticus TaxID=1507870 RepID=A0A1V8T6H7_9PEZI|nr:hypothetical protein B0A48_07495 [Cryoendolithus antarcticus]
MADKEASSTANVHPGLHKLPSSFREGQKVCAVCPAEARYILSCAPRPRSSSSAQALVIASVYTSPPPRITLDSYGCQLAVLHEALRVAARNVKGVVLLNLDLPDDDGDEALVIDHKALTALIAPDGTALDTTELPAQTSTGRKLEHDTVVGFYRDNFLYESDAVAPPNRAIRNVINSQSYKNAKGGYVWTAKGPNEQPVDVLMVDLLHIADFHLQHANSGRIPHRSRRR